MLAHYLYLLSLLTSSFSSPPALRAEDDQKDKFFVWSPPSPKKNSFQRNRWLWRARASSRVGKGQVQGTGNHEHQHLSGY
jgi:hypothetical protein